MTFKKLTPEQLRGHKGKSFVGITTAFICYDGQGNIFLAQRSENTRDEHGNWDAGGGGLKFGQTLEQNLIREVKEEYNFTTISIQFLGYMDVFRNAPDGEPTHWLAMFFTVLVNPAELNLNEPEMVDDSGWFTLDNLPTPMHSQFGPLLKLHGKKFREIISKK